MIPTETVLTTPGGFTDPHTGEFKVMQSQGNMLWYIGTMFLACGVADCPQCGDYNWNKMVNPKGKEIDFNSRETDYFKTKEEAETALSTFKETGELPNRRY